MTKFILNYQYQKFKTSFLNNLKQYQIRTFKIYYLINIKIYRRRGERCTSGQWVIFNFILKPVKINGVIPIILYVLKPTFNYNILQFYIIDILLNVGVVFDDKNKKTYKNELIIS